MFEHSSIESPSWEHLEAAVIQDSCMDPDLKHFLLTLIRKLMGMGVPSPIAARQRTLGQMAIAWRGSVAFAVIATTPEPAIYFTHSVSRDSTRRVGGLLPTLDLDQLVDAIVVHATHPDLARG